MPVAYHLCSIFLVSLIYVVGATIHEQVPKAGSMPQPFYRVLQYQSPLLQGNDIRILQNLIIRSPFVNANLTLTTYYDLETEEAVKLFQTGNKLPRTGIFEELSARILLNKNSYDGYKDDGKILPGYKYKVHVPVYANRSHETYATLYNSNMQALFKFRVRTHGQNDADGEALNQFSASGSTPTGLTTFDLNSPEPDPVSFGPYPINRAVQGLKGNSKFILNNSLTTIRSGILLHTGEWAGWNTTMNMPNSHGCIHTWPENCKHVWQVLIGLGVEMRQNTDGKLPYPYAQQGLLSVEQID